LSSLEPLIALPSSPGNVVPISAVEGVPVSQVVVGSSANPGLRDFWITSEILKGRKVHDSVSLDVNPTSRQVVENLLAMGAMLPIYQSGGRVHQAGCMGCIGMGQAPASGKNSLRTVPRNFPGRSGTLDDKVYLCSPETAAASALTGKITDPRKLEDLFSMRYPKFAHPEKEIVNTSMLLPPSDVNEDVPLEKGPNIVSLPEFDRLQNKYVVPVVLKLGDNISTDEILKAGVKVLSYRSNIPEISKWAFSVVRQDFYKEALKAKDECGGHIVVAGDNYAQGSSREHAAIAPRFLGQVAVLAKSYARLGWQNLVNFGIMPFEFSNPEDYNTIDEGDVIKIDSLLDNLTKSIPIEAVNETKGLHYKISHTLSERQVKIIQVGGVINYFRMPTRSPEESLALSDS
jgi:aconitate hydratase